MRLINSRLADIITDMNAEKHIVIGIVAHVDAGKTTLADAMLYLSGKSRELGSVDRQSSRFDTHALERKRGITVFSKQAEITLPHTALTILDTPGHSDFVGETERALSVLDYALLVISGTDGVQAHTQTIVRLLRRYRIPVIVFVTKMDISHLEPRELIGELEQELGGEVVDFAQTPEMLADRLALCSEEAMEEVLSSGRISEETIADLIRGGKIFPCLFGSGLHLSGVEELLDLLDRYTRMPAYGDAFSAKVYKITRDPKGARLTHLKVTGGRLAVKERIRFADRDGTEKEEKADSLRIYTGDRFETAETVSAGEICAIPGLTDTFAGQEMGETRGSVPTEMEPVMDYRILFPNGEDPQQMFRKILLLAEEDPQLHLRWNETKKEIRIRLMGKIQAEILQELIRDRFGAETAFSEGSVMYRETIRSRVEGMGHFEPLRHYAEVHLILDPLPRGSGIVIRSACSEDELDRNWQRLILTHLREKQHLGVLTGSPVTDLRITLAAGKAHLKHTEGGDFREATYRAVRQGLMKAESILLEPYYRFSIRVPPDAVGRVMSDIRAMHGEFESPENSGALVQLEGSAPVSELNGYADELLSFTHGKGRIQLLPEGYRPCHNAQQVIEETAYHPERDMENTADSVFCSHGAGVTVSWDRAEEYMHLPSCLPGRETVVSSAPAVRRPVSIDDKELEAIMLREFGPIRRREYSLPAVNAAPAKAGMPAGTKKERIIVDGYNVIFGWKSLKNLAADNLDLARAELTEILTNYAAFTGAELILVFDGFRSPGNAGARTQEYGLKTAYTKEGETADAYIERLVSEMGSNRAVRVVTADSLIRLTALRSGVLRTSSAEFEQEVREELRKLEEAVGRTNRSPHVTKLKDGKNGTD